jgi:hypothetical protein
MLGAVVRVPASLALAFALLGARPAFALEEPADVRGALELLEAPHAADRSSAERWLGEHLAPGDLPELAQHLASSSAEARRRLERALGGDERHLDLVALLLADPAPPSRALGEAALARLLAAWIGDEGLEPAPALRVERAFGDVGAARFRWSVAPGPLAPQLDALVRLGSRGIAQRRESERLDVALDPAVADSELIAPSLLAAVQEESFLHLLFLTSLVQGLEVEGFGLDWQEGRNAWLYILPISEAGKRRADEVLAGWLRSAVEPNDSAARSSACRALAGTGWGAALGWLERRWELQGDGAALEGLALAASRGRVVPSLATPEAVRRLLAEIDAALALSEPAADRRADRGRFALSELPPLGVAGADLTAIVAEGLEGAPDRSRFVRLAALAGMGAIPTQTRAKLRSALEAQTASGPPAVELEALRALAASTPAAEPESWGHLARAGELLELAASRSQEGALGVWMRSARLGPPESWRDPSALPASWGAWRRLLVAESWLALPGEERTAASHLDALPDDALCDPLVEARLRRLALGGLGPTLTQVLAEEAGTFGKRARLALLAGILGEVQHPKALASLVADGQALAACDLILLGALCAGPVRDGARGALVQAVKLALEGALADDPKQELDQPWARAVERAWNELMSAGLDAEADAWRSELDRMLRTALPAAQGPGQRAGRRRPHPLVEELRSQRWPRLASSEVTPLAELESPLPPP